MGRRQRDPDGHQQELTELDAARPYLALAREIRAEVEQLAAEGAAGTAGAASLVAAIDGIPERERARVARAIFDRLPAEEQWAVIERAFGDEEIRAHLAAERDARRARVREGEARHALVLAARAARRLDLVALPPGEQLTLGLFLPDDVRAAVTRGAASAAVARQVVLRATDEPGLLHVLEDVFNPRRGLFVTPGYDEATWASERLASHARVRLGALGGTPDGALEPALYPGGRVDVADAAGAREGRLHLGFALIGDEDVFAPPL